MDLWLLSHSITLAGEPALRCAAELNVHSTVSGACLENIWFVWYAVWDVY